MTIVGGKLVINELAVFWVLNSVVTLSIYIAEQSAIWRIRTRDLPWAAVDMLHGAVFALWPFFIKVPEHAVEEEGTVALEHFTNLAHGDQTQHAILNHPFVRKMIRLS